MSSAEVIPFTKATACGNDFLIVDSAGDRGDLAALSRKMCDRKRGVGADGVEWLFADSNADIHARLFNADGSEAEISGNGTRCVAAYLCSRRNKETFVVRTGAGLKTCTVLSRSQLNYEFEIAMGVPKVEEEISVPSSAGAITGHRISMGNPHFVSFVDSCAEDWQTAAAEIGRYSGFKQGMNVEFVTIRDSSNIDVRFFERGVGQTQSSGTGSCAAAVASIVVGRAKSPVRVHAEGGTQTVRWDEEVFLAGAATLICRGEFFV